MISSLKFSTIVLKALADWLSPGSCLEATFIVSASLSSVRSGTLTLHFTFLNFLNTFKQLLATNPAWSGHCPHDPPQRNPIIMKNIVHRPRAVEQLHWPPVGTPSRTDDRYTGISSLARRSRKLLQPAQPLCRHRQIHWQLLNRHTELKSKITRLGVSPEMGEHFRSSRVFCVQAGYMIPVHAWLSSLQWQASQHVDGSGFPKTPKWLDTEVCTRSPRPPQRFKSALPSPPYIGSGSKAKLS